MFDHLTDFFSATPGPQCSDVKDHGKTLCTACRWTGAEDEVDVVWLDLETCEPHPDPDADDAYPLDVCPKCGSSDLMDACCC